MNFINCYYPMCDHEAEVCCNCTSPGTYSCKNHFMNHRKSSNKLHKASPIFLEPAEDTRRALLSFLIEEKSKIDEIKTKIVKSFYQTLSNYENAFKEIIYEIDSDSTKISSIFDKVFKAQRLLKNEKDPVLNLLNLQSFEAVNKAKTIFTENQNIALFNNIEVIINEALFNFNEEKHKSIHRKRKTIVESTILNFDYEPENIRSRLNVFKDHINKNPNNHAAYHSIGAIFHEEKRYAEALEFYNDAIRINSNQAIYYQNKGSALYSLDRREEAMDFFEEAIRISPDKESQCNNIAIILCNQNGYEEALMMWNRAIEINPNKAIYYENKAKCLRALGLIEEAIECYKLVYKNNPKDLDNIYFKIANEFLSKKEYKEALRCYDEIKIKENNYVYFINKGEAFWGLRNSKNAIECYKEAIAINQEDIRALHGLAAISLDKKNYKEVLKIYKGRYDGDELFYRNIGFANLGLGRKDEALRKFVSAIDRYPNEDASYNLAGKIHYEKENYNRALEYYNRAIAINPNHAIYYRNKGECLKKLGRVNGAQECFDKARSMESDSSKL